MLYSKYKYGMIPDYPEPPECDGFFEESICQFCSSYNDCKAMQEGEDDNDDT